MSAAQKAEAVPANFCYICPQRISSRFLSNSASISAMFLEASMS